MIRKNICFVSILFFYSILFHCFVGLVVYDNEFETKDSQRQMKFKPRIKLYHNIYIYVSSRVPYISNSKRHFEDKKINVKKRS